MKIKIIFLILLITCNFIFSQKTAISSDNKNCFAVPIEESKNGKVKNNVYTCYMFDWKIKIPDNYRVMNLKMLQELHEKGYEAMTELTPGGIKIKTDPYHLISFGLGKTNHFTAYFESLAGIKKKSFDEHKKFMLQLLNDTYSKIKELKAVTTTSNMKIGKYDFY